MDSLQNSFFPFVIDSSCDGDSVVSEADYYVVRDTVNEEPARVLRGAVGDGYVRKCFASPAALYQALETAQFELVHEDKIADYLPPTLVANLRSSSAEARANAVGELVQILSEPLQVALQARILIFIKKRQYLRFCLAKPLRKSAPRDSTQSSAGLDGDCSEGGSWGSSAAGPRFGGRSGAAETRESSRSRHPSPVRGSGRLQPTAEPRLRGASQVWMALLGHPNSVAQGNRPSTRSQSTASHGTRRRTYSAGSDARPIEALPVDPMHHRPYGEGMECWYTDESRGTPISMQTQASEARAQTPMPEPCSRSWLSSEDRKLLSAIVSALEREINFVWEGDVPAESPLQLAVCNMLRTAWYLLGDSSTLWPTGHHYDMDRFAFLPSRDPRSGHSTAASLHNGMQGDLDPRQHFSMLSASELYTPHPYAAFPNDQVVQASAYAPDGSAPPYRFRTRARPIISCVQCRALRKKCNRVCPCTECEKRGESMACSFMGSTIHSVLALTLRRERNSDSQAYAASLEDKIRDLECLPAIKDFLDNAPASGLEDENAVDSSASDTSSDKPADFKNLSSTPPPEVPPADHPDGPTSLPANLGGVDEVGGPDTMIGVLEAVDGTRRWEGAPLPTPKSSEGL